MTRFREREIVGDQSPGSTRICGPEFADDERFEESGDQRSEESKTRVCRRGYDRRAFVKDEDERLAFSSTEPRIAVTTDPSPCHPLHPFLKCKACIDSIAS
jgi:hypothetical protein